MASAEKIEQRPVVSSNLASVGYNAGKNILAITFRSGSVVHMGSVPPDLVQRFLRAESMGRFYYREIKGKFPGEKMTGHCPKCGARHGWIGDVCTDCGTAENVADPMPPPKDVAPFADLPESPTRDAALDRWREHDPRD